MLSTDLDVHIKPFLRWAGGKTWLIKYLDTLVPNSFNQYHEPFLGSGAVFLSIRPCKNVFLSDLNPELINAYLVLQKNPQALIKHLKTFENTEAFYYKIRNEHSSSKIWQAAKFIFLNQTSFNGIYRVNLNGEYNVPYGHRKKDFINEQGLRIVNQQLQGATIFDGDFEKSRKNIRKGDLIFLDPPYTVSHNNNGFIKYNQQLFSLEDQHRLSKFIEYIRSKDAYYILTNAAHLTIATIFEKGDRKIELQRASLIGGLNAKRGQTSEYIFTNCK